MGPPVFNRFPTGKAPATKTVDTAAVVQDFLESDKKRNRTDAGFVTTDPGVTPGGSQADAPRTIRRLSTAPCGIAPPTLPPTTSGLQPDIVEWFVAAPSALQAFAGSWLTSYASSVRAPIAAKAPTGAPVERVVERVGHLRASPERAFRG